MVCGTPRSAIRFCCCSTTRMPSCWSASGGTGRRRLPSPTRCFGTASRSSWRARIWRARGVGAALVITPLPPTKADTAFGFSWFTTKLFAERRLMRDIVVAALVMHLIGLSVPIFFQLLVDKVVPNQAFSTLYALSAGVGVLILFDAGFNYLRNYLLAFITRRLDHQVANSTIEHLLRLPIDYFHANPSGVTAYKLQEANNVRDFLASRLFNT